MQGEEELVRKLREGDDEAFVKIVEKYRESAISLAFRITDDYHDAEDISQEAFAVLYKKIDSFRGESSLKTFFMSILINLARQRMRKKRLMSFISLSHYRDDEDERQIDIRDKTDIGKEIINKELRTNIEKAVSTLPVRQKEVFAMRHYEEMSLTEIAEITGCSVGTVKSHLFRAVAALRKKLKGAWDEMQ